MTDAHESIYSLALETSGAHGGVALGRGPKILRTGAFSGPRRHATELLPLLEALCSSAAVEPRSLGRVYVSAGPGSFTGLRIGITVARMLALAAGAKIVAVPTLEVIAQNAAEALHPPDHLAVILDAKRKRAYAASFRRTDALYAPTSAPAEINPDEFLSSQPPGCAIMGEGIAHHGAAVAASGLRVLPRHLHAPRCEVVYQLGSARAARGLFDDPRTLIPIYIRPPEAEEKWEQKHKHAAP